MKKNKKEAVKNSHPKSEEKKELIGGNDTPSEKASVIRNDESTELPFKKTLYGYNPEEVDSFIKELNQVHEATSKLHEEKLSSLKEELVLSNRERDYYIEKCRKHQSEFTKKALTSENNAEEYESVISQLTEKINALEKENEALRKSSESSVNDTSEAYIKKITELEAHNAELERNIVSAKKENTHLTEQAEKHKALLNEQKALLLQFEETKARLASCENDLKSKQEAIQEKTEKVNILSAEKKELQNRASELEIQNNMLTRHINEAEKEVAALKEANKNLVFENAEKINSLENEHAKEKLAFQKELKLYGYYVDRAELTVSELAKQIDQIKQSIQKQEI